jgi:hypothetical protein
MQGTAWIGLFRRIPESLHNCLYLMTTTGAEIVLQRLIRLDRDYLVALGRLSGTTDQAKVVIIPFDQMTYLSFGKAMTEEEVQGALGKPGVTVTVVEQPAAETPVTELPAADAETVEIIDFSRQPAKAIPVAATVRPSEPAPAIPSKSGSKMAPPSKTILLARLRERLANDISRQSGTP